MSQSNTALTKKQQNTIIYYIEEAKQEYLLNQWKVNIQFLPDDKKMSKSAVMDVIPDERYKFATIRVNSEQVKTEWKKYGEQHIKEICFHEVAHILINALVRVAHSRYVNENDLDDAQESLCEVITRIVLKHEDITTIQ